MTAPARSFEEQTTDAIRGLVIVSIVLATALILTIGLAVWGFSRASGDADQLKAVVREQAALIHSPKHVHDIAVWCDAINQQGAALVAYVDIFHNANRRIPALHLPVLDCPAIEQQSPGASPKTPSH